MVISLSISLAHMLSHTQLTHRRFEEYTYLILPPFSVHCFVQVYGYGGHCTRIDARSETGSNKIKGMKKQVTEAQDSLPKATRPASLRTLLKLKCSLPCFITLAIGLDATIRSFGRVLLGDGVHITLALAIGLDGAIRGFGRVFLGYGIHIALALAIGLEGAIGSFGRVLLRNGVHIALALAIGLNGAIGSFGRVLLRDGVHIALALAIGLDGAIGSFGRILLGDGVHIALALHICSNRFEWR